MIIRKWETLEKQDARDIGTAQSESNIQDIIWTSCSYWTEPISRSTASTKAKT